MSTRLKACAVMVSLSLLGACGGADTGFIPTPTPTPTLTDLQRFTNKSNAFSDRLDRIDEMFTSSAATMNRSTGTATFTGEAGLIVDPTFVGQNLVGAGTTVVGDANINVNFQNDSISGSLTNFIGADRRENVDTYTGSIRINNGVIGANSPEQVTANYSGTLRGNNETVVVGGELFGSFSGNPGVRAISLAGFGDTGTVNGIGDGSVLVVGANRN